MVGSIHSIDLTGTTTSGGNARLTLTDEQGGKGQLSAGGTLYVFGGSGGTLAVTASSAQMQGAVFTDVTGANSTTLTGSITC